MGLFEELQDLMIKYHFRPEKKLSQYFCTNEALLHFIAKYAEIKKGDAILEVGPGVGFLTRKLLDASAKVGAKVIALELDENMCNILSQEFSKEIARGELKIICANALEEDFSSLGVTKVISLPPYHISSELVTKLVLTKGLEKSILILDRGFIQKLLAFEGLSEYVALTVLVNLNSKVEVLEDNISPQSFFPAPNCQSSVIELDFDVKNNSKEFFIFLRELFRHKNKDLSRALKQALPFLSKELKISEKEFLKKSLGIPEKLLGKKVYLLSPKEFLEVFEALK